MADPDVKTSHIAENLAVPSTVDFLRLAQNVVRAYNEQNPAADQDITIENNPAIMTLAWAMHDTAKSLGSDNQTAAQETLRSAVDAVIRPSFSGSATDRMPRVEAMLNLVMQGADGMIAGVSVKNTNHETPEAKRERLARNVVADAAFIQSMNDIEIDPEKDARFKDFLEINWTPEAEETAKTIDDILLQMAQTGQISNEEFIELKNEIDSLEQQIHLILMENEEYAAMTSDEQEAYRRSQVIQHIVERDNGIDTPEQALAMFRSLNEENPAALINLVQDVAKEKIATHNAETSSAAIQNSSESDHHTDIVYRQEEAIRALIETKAGYEESLATLTAGGIGGDGAANYYRNEIRNLDGQIADMEEQLAQYEAAIAKIAEAETEINASKSTINDLTTQQAAMDPDGIGYTDDLLLGGANTIPGAISMIPTAQDRINYQLEQIDEAEADRDEAQAKVARLEEAMTGEATETADAPAPLTEVELTQIAQDRITEYSALLSQEISDYPHLSKEDILASIATITDSNPQMAQRIFDEMAQMQEFNTIAPELFANANTTQQAELNRNGNMTPTEIAAASETTPANSTATPAQTLTASV